MMLLAGGNVRSMLGFVSVRTFPNHYRLVYGLVGHLASSFRKLSMRELLLSASTVVVLVIKLIGARCGRPTRKTYSFRTYTTWQGLLISGPAPSCSIKNRPGPWGRARLLFFLN
ncbi:hypothetical protein KSP39_PZI008396 [Platanthera zijinensis]|uniref:Uncharacterized protein n=1 Tax=Platanthera zijinensis TaxID=2320716 RepID=A0AAP0BNS7_9ASPA